MHMYMCHAVWGVLIGCCTVLSGVWGVACSLLGSEAKANKKKLHSRKKNQKNK
jgi:hypothetical protein